MSEPQTPQGTPLVELRPATAAPPAVASVGRQRIVFNTFFLVLSQFVTTPLGVLVNAVLARSLGADDFGTIYLASTMAGLGFLLVDWGQQLTITARVALRREDAAETLGTANAIKLAATVVIGLAMVLAARLLGYTGAFYLALGLTFAQQAFVSLASNYTAVMRGFERLDWVSGYNISSNLLSTALVIPVALLGGRLAGTLGAQAVAALLSLIFCAWLATRLKFGRPRATPEMARALVHAGGGFVLFNLVLAVQPNVDAAILSRLASTETVGHYAAARRLIGVLIFPATTVGYVLFPIMSRLWKEDPAQFRKLLATTLRLTIVIGVCASMGTYLFASFAIQVVYSRAAFGPAVTDLQVLSGFIFLLYFTLILGAAIAASGKQTVWAGAQVLCIVVSAIGDPLLIPLCARRFGNGGMGVCVSTVASELLMLAAAAIILRGMGVLRPMTTALFPAAAGGAAMWLSAKLLQSAPVPVAMVASVLGYGIVAYATGGVESEHVALIKDIVRAKTRRPTPMEQA